MTTKLQTLNSYLVSQLGESEHPDGTNKTKFGVEFGWDGVFWCQIFAYIAYLHADITTIKTASTRVAADWFEKQGRLTKDFSELRPGYSMFMNFDSRPNNIISSIEHVGICILRPNNGLATNIEGNTTGPTETGDQTNGGVVAKRTRPPSVFVCAGIPEGLGGKAKHPAKLDKPDLGLGDRGHDVRLWQHLLNVVDKANLRVDGHFGAATDEATKKWQRAHGKKPDGTVWPDVIHNLEQKVLAL